MTPDHKLNFSQKFQWRLKVVALILLAIAVIGILSHLVNYYLLKFATAKQAILSVAAIHAEKSSMTEEIILPGNMLAWHETTIYARTNGYVVKWIVDIGAHVKEGDLLAEITAPEVDAQLRQTEADLKTAEANYALAESTAVRWKKLLKTESVSKQETDEKVTAAKAQAAIVVSTRANRDRLLDLVNFQRIVAPFDGVIMSRTTDIGRLINAGSGTVPLFRLVQVNRLRVYIKVPEYYSKEIKPGLEAKLFFTEHPGKSYVAKLLDTAKAIDATTRTLLVQFEIDNADEELLSGSYAEVHLLLPTSNDAVNLPVNTLIFRANGLQVATLDKDNKAILKSIVIGRDYGDYIEVLSGVAPGETIILNPSDSLSSGQAVKVVWTDNQKGKTA